MVSWTVLIYALLVAVGGVLGYVRAGSVASLVAGLVSGLLLVGSAVAMMRGAFQPGWWLALVVTILMLARFGMAAATKGFKFMPGGLVIVTSILVLIMLLSNRSQS
jgi:uncharacterized membrane protein (UPF0136 family)